MIEQNSKGLLSRLRAAAAAAGVAVALVIGVGVTAAVAQEAAPAAPAAPSAGELKPFEQAIPGTNVKFQMVPVPGGKFKMGSPDAEEDRGADEGPQVEVEVEPFYMGAHEVTWGTYNNFLANYHRLSKDGAPAVPADKMADAVTYPTPLYEQEAGPVIDRMGRGDDYPAVIMSHFAARQYTKWLSKRTGRFYRLPTEAEWEYACRAGTATAYHFGDDAGALGDHAWFYDNSDPDKDGEEGYQKVGQKKPNAFGLYDMHGNVAEWTLDAYKKDWYAQFAGKTVKAADIVNWPGGKSQYPRVIRGGGWSSEAEEARAAIRIQSKPAMNVKDPQLPKSPHWMTEGFWIGFRVVSPAKEPSEAEKLKYWNADDDMTKRIIARERERHELIAPPQAGASAAK